MSRSFGNDDELKVGGVKGRSASQFVNKIAKRPQLPFIKLVY
jgi:hypothetical protein